MTDIRKYVKGFFIRKFSNDLFICLSNKIRWGSNKKWIEEQLAGQAFERQLEEELNPQYTEIDLGPWPKAVK